MAKRPLDAESAARLGLVAPAVIVYGLFLGSAWARAERGWPTIWALLLASSFVGSPFLVRALQRSLARRGRLNGTIRVLTGLAQGLPFLLLEPGLDSLAPALLVLLQGFFLANARDTRAGVAAAGLAPMFVLIQMSIVPGRIWLYGFVASVFVSLISFLLLSARESHRWLARRAPVTFGAAWGRNRPAPASDPRLFLYGAAVALIVLVTIPLFYLPLLMLPVPELTDSARAPEAEEDLDATAGSTSGKDAQQAFQQIFPSEILTGEGVAPLVSEVVMELVPVPPSTGGAGARPRDRGPLYLRGMVLDTVLERGVTVAETSDPPELLDREDGRRDGWTEIPGAGTGPVYELEVLQQPIRIRDGTWTVLFGPRPLAAVELPRLRHDPDGMLVFPEPREDWLEYRLRARDRPALPARADGNVPARFLELPQRSPAIERIRALAEEITLGARNDRERVQRVVDHFRDRFAYSLEATDFPGLAGVVEFLDRRSGYCTYYASAATLLLRAVGVPARIATGFLASEWSESRERYIVTTKHGHAWIEVAFEGVGWVSLDPTPGDSRAAAIAALEADPSDGLGSWLGLLYYDLEQWIATGDQDFMRAFASALRHGPRALWSSFRRAPWIALPLFLWVVYLLYRRSGRRRHERPFPTPDHAVAESDLYVRLVRAVERHGFSKAAAMTPREFAVSVGGFGNPELGRFASWTERFYRARYGDEPMSVGEREELRAYIHEVGRAARALGRN